MPRIERFNVTDDGAVVIVHPQAKPSSKLGTVVARIEPWVSHEGRRAIVEALNAAAIEAPQLSGGLRP